MRGCLIGIGVIVAGVVLAASGCSEKACTLKGCQNTFTATVKRADGTFPAGTHRIEILSDGVTQMCTFAFAESSPGLGGATSLCLPGLTVEVANEQLCTETHTASGVSLRCDPIPGRFIETITFIGAPSQLHVWQYVDGAAILDAAAAPSYADVFPNGPECGGACRQASASWTLQ